MKAKNTVRVSPSRVILFAPVLAALFAGCNLIRSEPPDLAATPLSELAEPSASSSIPGDGHTPQPGTSTPSSGEVTTSATTAAIPTRPVPPTPLQAGLFEYFGSIAVEPDFEVNGQGENVDSIAFWEAQDPTGTLMFVTAKANQLVEVWRYPFEGQEQSPINGVFGSGQVNGIVMDQESGLLYIAQSQDSSTVYAISISGEEPYWQLEETFSGADLGSEPNLGLLHHANAGTWLYITDSAKGVFAWDVGPISRQDSPGLVIEFSAAELESIETILADDYYQVIYIPDENGRSGVYAYQPDGAPYLRDDTNRFGNRDIFQSDEEGILLYRCHSDGGGDTGRGLIVVADQRDDQTDFEFFDRQSWEHLGSVQIQGVSNTDGIASTQQVLPDYPRGLFTAINDDETTVGAGWDKILTATGLRCEDD